MLIIWSREAVRSQWVRSEADRARLNGTLIQVRIEDCTLPMPFDQIQCPLLRQWTGERSAPALAPVLVSLSELLKVNFPEDGGSIVTRAFVAVPPPRSDEAQLLLDGAMKALQSGQAAEHAQAVALLTEATSLAPDDAEIWGLLAVLYAARRSEVPVDERAAMAARARSAIRTAQNLDPDEVRASCAEAILIPAYRNWRSKEAAARRVLDRVPDQPLALFSLANVLASTGRWGDARAAVTKISRSRFLLPVVEEFTVQAFWATGDLVQAEVAAERARRRFPVHSGLLETHAELLMHSGQPSEAIRLLQDERNTASAVPAAKISAALVTARAIAGEAAPTDSAAANLDAVIAGELDGMTAAQHLAALALLDDCFDLLDGYYFRKGRFAVAAPRGGDEDRSTAALVMPPMAALWSDGRFETLVNEIGLTEHWSQTAVTPDCKR